MVGTYDGAELKLYVDGTEVSSGALTGPVDYDPLPDAGFVVGSYLDDNDDIRFEGDLTQVEVWSRALTATEIRDMFTLTGAVVCPSGFACVEDAATGKVMLSWLPPDNVDATGLELSRDGEIIATLALDATSYTDAPPNAAAPGQVEIAYTLKTVGAAAKCPALSCIASFFNGTLTDGLLVHLTFDSDAQDSSGNQVTTTVEGEPTEVDGVIGGALDFDDTADPRQYVILDDVESLQFGENGDFSVSFWLKTESPLTDNRDNGGTNYDPAIISSKDWNSGSNPGWVISANSSNAGDGVEGHLEWNIGDGGARADFDTTDALINDGEWHHVLVSHDRDDVASFYLDGRSLGTIDISGIGDIDSGFTTNIATDGAEGGTWENWFPGALDDLAIWSRVVSPEEAATIHSAGREGASALGCAAVGGFAINSIVYTAPDRGVTLTWEAKAIGVYSVEVSPDLRAWQELEDGITGANGVASFTDTGFPVAEGFRYYRVVLQ